MTAIKNILNDPKYQKAIQETSKILKDQPMNPLDKAIFWVEHVLRHKGGRHLRSAAVDLSLAQYLLLDVVACLASILGIFVFGVYFTCKKLCGKKNTRKIPKEKKTKAKLA
ncbi:UDP-glycosyltransferase family 302 member E1 [Carabus blaptoides fortunei]